MVKLQRNRWKKEEEEALIAGVAKHGTGKWMYIIEDPEFSIHLQSRSNIDLKDKWRNIKNTKERVKTEELR